MSYIDITNVDYGFFDPQTLAQKGGDLAEAYRTNDPFPHIVIDDFCSPEILRACLDAFPNRDEHDTGSYDREQERLKKSFDPERLTPTVRSFFHAMNSGPFLKFLENLTGIEKLLPDPYFVGGGFHETIEGGHLSVHADFNYHGPLHLERRLNLLIYLNDDWKPEYGGCLELWDRDMKRCVQSVAPIFNRCVVFTTTSESFHGHPEPIRHPDKAPRRSIALYYYTATWDDAAKSRTTQFKTRPGTGDRYDWSVRTSEALDDLVPPLLLRNIRRITRKFS